MDRTIDFQGYLKRLSDGDLEVLLHQACSEELARWQAMREERKRPNGVIGTSALSR